MKFSRELASELVDELPPLNELHYREVYPGAAVPLKVDYDRYLEAEKHGGFLMYAVRDLDNRLVGYAGFATYRHGHTGIACAQCDIIFIRKEKRGIGKEFISWIERDLKENKIEKIIYHVPINAKWQGALEVQGYSPWETIYHKDL